MTRVTAVTAFIILLMLMGTGASFVWDRLERERRLSARLQAVRPSEVAGVVGQRSGYDVTNLVTAIGSGIARSGLLSQKTLGGLEKTLMVTGLRGPSALGLFVGAKLVLMLAVPLLAWSGAQYLEVDPWLRNLSVLGGAAIGLLAPDWWVGHRYKQHLRAITAGLPDALDLMVICSEAGLSFEPTIVRVAQEIRTAHPVIADEFAQTANELRLVADSRVALTNLGNRTGLEGVRRMTSMLVQSMRYGTPMSNALRVLSAEMRQELLMRFETRAARLPVLLTIPMILFILPCIFLIVGGPAVVQVLHAYSN